MSDEELKRLEALSQSREPSIKMPMEELEGTGLDPRNLLVDLREMREALEKADQWILNNPRVTSWGAVDPVSEKERGDVRAAIAEALK